MPTVYLCGSLAGLSDEAARGWRDYAKTKLQGWTILDPMRRDYRGKKLDNPDIVDEIIMADLKDLDKCDAVLVNAKEPKWGSAMEVYLAFSFRILCYAFNVEDDNPDPWLLYHCQPFKDLNAAIVEMQHDALSSYHTGE